MLCTKKLLTLLIDKMFINKAPISKNQSKKLALLIGIEYTNTDNYLPGCIGDVVEMYNMLVNIYNIHPHNIIQLTDTNKIKPTRKNIIQSLELLKDKSNNSILDEIVIYYSGHGNQIKEIISNNEIDGMDEVIVPLDWESDGLITDNKLHSILKNYNENINVKCIFDSCNSGTILDLQYNYYYNTDNNSTNIIDRENNKLSNNIICISGCKDKQTSNVVLNSDGVWKSALTTILIQLFSKHNNGVTFHSLDKQLNDYMVNQKLSQAPVISSSKPYKPGYIVKF